MVWDDGYLMSMSIPYMIIRSVVQLASKRVTSLACFVSPLEGDHNISCDHEVEKDQHGTSRHYLVLRTSSAIFRNEDLTSMAGLGLI